MLYICAALTFKGEPGFRLVSTEGLNGRQFPTMDAPSTEVNRLIQNGAIKGYRDNLEEMPFIRENRGSVANKNVYTVVTAENLSEWYLVDSGGYIVESWESPSNRKSDIWNGRMVYYLDNNFTIQQGYLADGIEYRDFVSDLRKKRANVSEEDIKRVQRKINMIKSTDVRIDDEGTLSLVMGASIKRLVIPEGVINADNIYGAEEIVSIGNSLQSIKIPVTASSVDLSKAGNLKEVYFDKAMYLSKVSLPDSVAVLRSFQNKAPIFIGSGDSFKDWEKLSVHTALLRGTFKDIEIGHSKSITTAKDLFYNVIARNVKIGGNIDTIENAGNLSCRALYLGDSIKSLKRDALRISADEDKEDRLDIFGGANLTGLLKHSVVFTKPLMSVVQGEYSEYIVDLHLEQKPRLKKVDSESLRFSYYVLINNLIMCNSLQHFEIGSTFASYTGIIKLSTELDEESIIWILNDSITLFRDVSKIQVTEEQIKFIGNYVNKNKAYSYGFITKDEFQKMPDNFKVEDALEVYVDYLVYRGAKVDKVEVFNKNTGNIIMEKVVRRE